MAALALPLIAFYFGAGGIALLVDKKRDRKSRLVADDDAAPIDAAAPIPPLVVEKASDMQTESGRYCLNVKMSSLKFPVATSKMPRPNSTM